MKNKKGIKLMITLFICLFTVSLTTGCGCSCTSSLCSETDIDNIKANIKKENIEEWNQTAIAAGMTIGSEEYNVFIDEKVNEIYESHPKACLVTEDDIDPSTNAVIEKKTWGDAWKAGLLDGLIVFPIGWLLSKMTSAFGGGGLSQISAILIITLIIRTLMLLVNFKGQLGTIRLQSVQGELNKINEKLRDPNLTQQEKSALSMKMMDIYKKNDINPLSSLVSQFISFPVFIAVWAAMNQTLAIRKGEVLNLKLGTAINTQIFEFNITAIILFALMIAGQIITMKLGQWLKIRKEKKKNPNYVKTKSDSEKQMNMMMYLMIGLVVMSGFLLPAALVIYWFFGSLFSMLQTFAFNSEYVNKKLKSLADRKKKAKIVR